MKITISLRISKKEMKALLENCLIDMNAQVNGVPLRTSMKQMAKQVEAALRGDK
jgi:hypothetical protein